MELEDIQDYLRTVAGWNAMENLDDEEIRLVAERLASIWSSRREAILANKNGTEVLADLLSSRKRHWFRLPKIHKGFVLTQIDLSGAILERDKLSGTDLEFINGFREIKNFTETDLRGMKHLSREDREYARYKGAIIDEPESEKSEKTTK